MHVGSVGRRFKYKINTVRGQDQQEFVSLWLSDSVEDTSFTLSSLSKDFINRIGSIGRRSSVMVEKQMGRPASVGWVLVLVVCNETYESVYDYLDKLAQSQQVRQVHP